MSPRVAVVGGSGFVGRHVVAAIDRRTGMTPVVLTRTVSADIPSRIEHAACDVTARGDTLHRSLAGCDLVINASSYVGDDIHTQSQVNVAGVAAIIRAAGEIDIPVVHISTAGVYGTLPFSGGVEGDYPMRPESSLSRSRAEGDALVLGAGETVLRPLFVTGASDRHFLLPVLRAHLALDAWIDGGEARLTVTSAEFVAEVVATVAQLRLAGAALGALHVVPRRPVSVHDLLTPVLAAWGRTLRRSVSAVEAADILGAHDVPGRKVGQFAADYYLSSSAPPEIGHRAGDEAPAISENAMRWYAEQRPASALPAV